MAAPHLINFDPTGYCEIQPRLWSHGENISVSTVPVFSTKSEPMTLQPSLKDMIAFEIGAVPQVDAVFTQVQDRIVYVWTVLRDSSRNSRRAVYAQEQVIMNRTEHMDFNFNVVNGAGSDPRGLFKDDDLELAFIRE